MSIQRPSEFTRAVGAEVRGFIRSRGLSQTDVADQLGRSQSYVSLRVNGKAAFDMDDVDGIAKLMGLDGVEFLQRVAKRVAEDRAVTDELSDRRARIAAASDTRPHAAYDSNDGIPESATEDDFTT